MLRAARAISQVHKRLSSEKPIDDNRRALSHYSSGARIARPYRFVPKTRRLTHIKSGAPFRRDYVCSGGKGQFMSKTMEMLQVEHRNMSELLDLLERQVDRLDGAGDADYDFLGEIIDYFRSFPDLYHHPKEDPVFARLTKRDPEAAAAMGDLQAEHEKVNARLNGFTRAVVNVLLGAEMPRSKLTDVARDFIDGERRHMKAEETIFFPAAKKALIVADWKEIDAKVSKFQDPLFETGPTHRFEMVQKMLGAVAK